VSGFNFLCQNVTKLQLQTENNLTISTYSEMAGIQAWMEDMHQNHLENMVL